MVTIVDDDELVRSALSGLMKSAGFPALAFACAEEFLSSGEQKRTGCLIADIRMPGMSGLDRIDDGILLDCVRAAFERDAS